MMQTVNRQFDGDTISAPCKVGDHIFVISVDGEIEIEEVVAIVARKSFADSEVMYYIETKHKYHSMVKTHYHHFRHFGHTVFTSFEEAEQALKERQTTI